MRKMIRGKYDSQFKYEYEYNIQNMKRTGRRQRGTFDTAMNYARKHKGGIKLIQHIRNQPWTTWQALKG